VRDLGTEQGFSFEAAGERSLKGFAEPVSVFALR
jgi:class 3 adenylate cyclase